MRAGRQRQDGPPKQTTLRAIAAACWSVYGIFGAVYIAGFFVIPWLVDRFVLVPSDEHVVTALGIWHLVCALAGYQLYRYDQEQHHLRNVIRSSEHYLRLRPSERAQILRRIARDRRLRAIARRIGLRWYRYPEPL